MHKRKLLMVLVVLLLIVATLPVHAQEDDELTDDEIKQMVETAYLNLNKAGYYAYAGSQEASQIFATQPGQVQRGTIHQSQEVQVTAAQIHINSETGVPDLANIVLAQSSETYVNEQNRNATDISMDMQLRLLDETLYLKIGNVQGVIFEQALERLASDDYPYETSGWLNVSEEPERLAEYLRFLDSERTENAFLDSLQLNSIISLSQNLFVSADMIDDVRVLEDEEGDVFYEITLNPMAVMELLNIDDLVTEGSMRGDVDGMLEEMFDAMTLTQQMTFTTVTIDEEELIVPRRVVTEMSIQDLVLSEAVTGGPYLEIIESTMTTTVVYQNVGTAFELSPPGPELSVEGHCNEASYETTFTIHNVGSDMDAPINYTVEKVTITETEGDDGQTETTESTTVEVDNTFQLQGGSETIVLMQPEGIYVFNAPDAELTTRIECVAEEEAE